ncbi:MAG: PAS domain-containing sensor histidine kinase, partial [Anaerolineae bacterium]
RREEVAREARNALEIKLVSSRAEGESLAQRLAEIESDLAQTHANANAQIRWHEQELIRQQLEWEETLQDAEAIQQVLHGMTAGLIITDSQGQIEEVNVAAEILLDQGGEELRGVALGAINDDDRWQQAVRTARGGEAVRLTMPIGMNTLLCDVAPLQASETAYGSEPKLVAVFQDISTETEEQRARLEAIALLAEELRTPITTIISYTDLLLSEAIGILGEAQRKFLLRIKAGAERMSQMVSALTREAGGEEHWAKPQRQTVDLNKLVETTIAGAHTQLEDRALTLDLDLPEDLPSIKADPDYMRRVVANLLSNACLASSVGSQIQVRTVESAGTPQGHNMQLNGDRFVVFAIQDAGGGLPDEALGRIFDRGRPSQTPAGLGESGAGLALVKTLVEAHGGRLWVESQQGAGTTFSFILPANDLSESTGEASAAGES